MKKRILSILMTLVMVIGMLPTVAFAAEVQKVTWENQTFTSDQYFVTTGGYDTLELTLVGDNKITITGPTSADHGREEQGLFAAHDNLIIGGTGTLTIKMNMTGVGNYVSLYGIYASNIVITDSAKVIIEVAGSDSHNTGIICSTISVEDNASIDITVTGNKQYATDGIDATRWASFTSKAESNITVYAKPDSLDAPVGYGVIVGSSFDDREGNGNITVKNGSLNVTMLNPDRLLGTIGSALCSKGNTLSKNGVILIENATVATTIGDTNAINKKAAIASEAPTGGTITDSIIIKNSNVTINGMQGGGIRSDNYGVLIEDSNVKVTSSYAPGGEKSGSGIWAKERLIINGNSDVSVTTNNYEPIIVNGNVKINLSEGGKLTVEDKARDTFKFSLVRLGVNNVVTQGTSEILVDDLVNITAADNKFVVEYKESGSGEGGETSETTVNVVVTAPVAGKFPDSNATIDNAGFTIGEIRWCDNANGYATLDGSVPFVGGNKYQCVVFLEAKEGYDLASIEKVTINGNTATYGTAGSAKYYYYDFTATGGVAPSITGITIDPTSAEVTKGNTQQFTATVTGEGEFDDSVQWSVSGGTASTIDANGLLTVGAGETATELTVIAKAAADNTKTATATVAVPNVITATVTDINVTGTVDTGITVQEFRIYVEGDTFGMSIPADITDWFKNIPTGLKVEKLECAGGRLTVRVSGTPTVASDEVMQIVIPADALTNSDSALTVNTNANAKYAITAGSVIPTPKTLTEISVTTAPSKTTYTAGENFDETGMVVTATYSDSSTAPVTGYTVTDGTALAEGKTSVTISYTEGGVTKTTTQAITVNAAPVVPVTYIVTVTNGTGSGDYAEGASVTITANAAPAGKVFDKWVIDGITVEDPTATTITFTMPANSVSAEATYKDQIFIVNYLVTFDFNDGTGNTAKVLVAQGDTVAKPADPTRSGYTFKGWYLNGTKYDFTAPVTETITLTAKWDKNSTGGGIVIPTVFPVTVKESDNGEVEASAKYAVPGSTVKLTVTPDEGYELDTLIVKSGSKFINVTEKNGKYQFVMPFGSVTVTATFKKIETPVVPDPVVPSFDDVAEDTYYFDAVEWAVENGITTGTSDTTFSPDMTCTRAQAVTFLWRAAGSPEPKSNVMPFEDVAAEAYYYKAVLWAVENGITKGTSDTTFSPDADCTRAQIVTFLWRAQKSPAAIGVNPFTDVAADAYYVDAVLWAVEEKVTKGTSETTFSPDADCTRAQIVTFLYRALNEQ